MAKNREQLVGVSCWPAAIRMTQDLAVEMVIIYGLVQAAFAVKDFLSAVVCVIGWYDDQLND